MIKSIFSAGFLFLISLAGLAQDLSLDQVMERYYTASEIEKMQQVNTVIMTGLRVQQDIMPLKIIRKRPNRFLMEFDVADLTAYQAFDGEQGWTTAPWTGNPAPQPLPEARNRDMMYNADFDGMLYNWKEKGNTLELTGIDTIEDGLAYRINLIRADSALQIYHIDTESFLLKKQTTFRTVRGEEIAIENVYDDYRMVDGIPFAFIIENRFPGRSVSMEFDTIELNTPVEDSLFRMPD